MALAPLLLPIISLFRSAGITQARQAMFGLNKDFTHFAQSVGKAAGAFAAFQVLSGGREFALQSIEQTQRFERNLLAIQQVFEEVTPQLRAFTREAENYGLSQGQAAQASVFLGSVLKQYGLTIEESAMQTERLVTLAQDLATTYGYDVQEALLAITALFRGEYDPIEKFGVAMKQNEVNARLAADGLGDLEGEELALATAQTRLTMLFERANDSIGAYTRAIDTLYGAQQQLNAVVQNMQIAFGASLQQPIADVINQFAELAQKYGPDVAEIGASIGNTLSGLAPIIGKLGETFFLLLAPLEQIIGLLGTLLNIVGSALSPVLTVVNGALGLLNDTLNALTIVIGDTAEKLGFLNDAGRDFGDWLESVASGETYLFFFSGFLNLVRDAGEAFKNFVDQARNNEFTESSRDAAMLSNAIRNFSAEAEEASDTGAVLEEFIRNIGVSADEVTGKTSSLTEVFNRIQEAAEQSKAKEAMEEIGLSAGLIEEVLTSPNWAGIFGAISELARLTAIDISQVFSLTAVAGISNRIAELQAYLADAFTVDSGGSGSSARNYVKDFFAGIDDEVQKQVARRKLAGMGASEGLIQSILGTAGWEKVFDAIISGGTRQLRRLQEQFNRTSAGIDELNRLQEEAIALTQEQEEAAREAAEALQRQQDEYAALVEKLEDFKRSISGIALEGTLATIEQEVGRFEQSIIRSFDSIQSRLASALDNGSIFQNAYNQLVRFANQEQQALQQIARQRDELAAKGDWVESLLRDYRSAFTGALNLTGILNQLESQSRQVLVTEVTRGVRGVSDSMKELELTITRSYTETISNTANKTEALLTNFRDVAQRARQFAQNLEELRRLGLDPMLFNQLVEAGVEAGGETAQALIDGGSSTIQEINSLFQEIGDMGVKVGESVALDFYETGENFASSLLDGIRSQQAAFEETARQMAAAFEQEFGRQTSAAAGQVQQVANLSNQLSAAELEQQRIQNRIQEQIDILTGGVAGPNARAWAEKKLESYQDQLEAVQGQIGNLTGQIGAIQVAPLATGGIALGAALAMIGEGGPEAVIPLDKLDEMINTKPTGQNIQYNINVTADTRAGGVAAGEAIVAALKTYGQANGPVNSLLGTSQVTL